MNPSSWINPFTAADSAPPRTLGRFMLWCLSGSFPILFLAVGISAIVGALEVVTAILLGFVIDGALENGTGFLEQGGSTFLLLIGFFLVLRPAMFGLGAMMQSVVVGPNIMPLVLSRLNRYTLGHSVQFFDEDFAGRIAQKQMQTSRAVTEVVIEIISVVSFSLSSLVVSAFALSFIDWRVSVALLVWLVLYLSLIRWFMPRIRLRSGKRAAARAALSGQIVDTITNIKTVKLFAHHKYEDAAALDAMRTLRRNAISFGSLAALFRFSLMSIAGLVPVVLVGGALFLWSKGLISAGDIAATGAISLRVAQMTGWVSFALMGIYAAVGEIEDGMNTLTPSHGLIDAPNAKPLTVKNASIDFQSVSFTYGGQIGGVTDISLSIKAGEKLGIVGASGAGKSTLVALLMRLYDPATGKVLIDGQALDDVSQESLRRQIGMVTQETSMFNRSALDNILYGRPDATKEDIISAAKKAEAYSFIQDLTDHMGRTGFDAYLGERGVKLSGGQRQRIALARAILKDAPILILDEATSALDSEVEAAIQTALTRVMEGKTVLAIAHRLSTIAKMDRIIVLDQGRIIEEGTHDGLLRKGGLYARYWNRQSGGFIGIDETTDDNNN